MRPRATGFRVSARHRTPHLAVWVSAAAAFAVALWADAYSAMVALSTIALYASYGLPIAAGLLARRDGRWQARGPWDLGRAYSPLAGVCVVGCLGLVVVAMQPPNEQAAVALGGALTLLGVFWIASG